MKRILVAFMLVSLGLFPAILLAEDLTTGAIVGPIKVSKPHGFELGLMYYHFDYEEDVPPPGKSTEKGWLPGFYLGYAYNHKDDVHTKVFIEFSSGDADYDGTTQGGTPIKFSDNPQDFFRF